MKPLQLTLTLDEINLALEALGQLPYQRVHNLIARIHQQAAAQLEPPPNRPDNAGLQSDPVTEDS